MDGGQARVPQGWLQRDPPGEPGEVSQTGAHPCPPWSVTGEGLPWVAVNPRAPALSASAGEGPPGTSMVNGDGGDVCGELGEGDELVEAESQVIGLD